MEKILGIGGFFWRAKDPDALGQWYEDNFVITIVPKAYHEEPWRQEAGTTVVAPFKETTTYISADKQWMINFRVRDLKAWSRSSKPAAPRLRLTPSTIPTAGSRC